MEVSVVVPCFNEEARLPSSLSHVLAFLERSGRDYEIVLVDDGSTDRTPALIERAAREHPRVRGVRLAGNRGKGRALAEGVRCTTGALVLTSDADFSTPIDEMPKLEAAIAAGCEVAIGSRARRGAREVDQPLYRRVMGKGFNLLVQALVLPGVWDTQCGFKLFRGEVARGLFGGMRTDGYAHDVEILWLARRAGYRLCEVPVRWINSATSRVDPVRHSGQMLRDLLRIRLAR